MSHTEQILYEFGPFRLNPFKRSLWRGSRAVPLTPKAFDVLVTLVERGSRLVEKDELMKVLWPDSFVEEANLTQNISLVRKALGESPHDHRYIVTVPGRGYRFVSAVRRVGEAGAEAGAEESSGAQNEHRAGADVKSVAVLPFETLGAGAGDEYLGLGLADALITKLSNLQQILTRPTSAVRKFRERGRDPVRAGRELGVDFVLEGAIQRVGERLRVTVQLINVHTDAPLWAGKFDERFTDIFGVEDVISEQVVRALVVQLSDEERRLLLTRHRTGDADAYRHYLKGLYHWNRRTAGALRKAVAHFEHALRLDPGYASAYVGLSNCFNLLNAYNIMPPADSFPRASAAARKALEFDEHNAEAYAALGFVKSRYEWDWEGAERDFLRAIAINPRHPTVRQWYGTFLASRGRFEEALAELECAQNLDPLSLAVGGDIGRVYYYTRQYDRAITQCRELLELDPSFASAHAILMMVYAQKRMYREAIAAGRSALKASNADPEALAFVSGVYGAAGHRAKALAARESLRRRAEREYVSPFAFAIFHTFMGETDTAFEWLERARVERSGLLSCVGVLRFFDALRSDPRFDELLQRMKPLKEDA